MVRETGETYLGRKKAFEEIIGDPSEFKGIQIYEGRNARDILENKSNSIRGSIPLRLSPDKKECLVGIIVGGERKKGDVQDIWDASSLTLDQQNYLHRHNGGVIEKRLSPLNHLIELVKDPIGHNISPHYYNWLTEHEIPKLAKQYEQINANSFSKKRTKEWEDYVLMEVKDILPPETMHKEAAIPLVGNLIFSPKESYTLATLVSAKALGVNEICFVKGKGLEYETLNKSFIKKAFPPMAREETSWTDCPVKAYGRDITPSLFIGYSTFRKKIDETNKKPSVYLNKK